MSEHCVVLLNVAFLSFAISQASTIVCCLHKDHKMDVQCIGQILCVHPRHLLKYVIVATFNR